MTTARPHTTGHQTQAMEKLLAQYATGALRPYESLLVATLLSLNAHARQLMQSFEAECGRMIAETTPAKVSDDCMQKVLAAIGKPAAAPKAKPAPRDVPADVPEPLRSLMARNCRKTEIRWTRFAPGVEKCDVHLCVTEPGQRRLRVMRLQPRSATPLHHHSGKEITLVLQGGFSDETGHYAMGDLLILEETHGRHSPRADEEGCICLVLTESPVRFVDPFIRLLNVFHRI